MPSWSTWPATGSACSTFLESEGLIVPNTDNQMAGPAGLRLRVGPARPGHDRPGAALGPVVLGGVAGDDDHLAGHVRGVLPALPGPRHRRFGLVYYGCCEPVHDRLELIMRPCPTCAPSRSPPGPTSTGGRHAGPRLRLLPQARPGAHQRAHPALGACEPDLRRTYEAARDCNVELLFRDVYDIAGDRTRLARWVELARSVFDM